MAKQGLTKAANISATARQIDFVSKFGTDFQALLDIMGVSDVIEKQPGSVVRYFDAKVTLNTSTVGEGDETPYSEAQVVEKHLPEMDLEPYSKGTSAKAIKDYGYDIAVGKTDEAFRHELTLNVMNKFYTFLKTGSTTGIYSTFQMALAMAKGHVDNEFKKLLKESLGTVGFVNTLDFHQYLGGAAVTIQTQNGYNYIKDFMGYNTIFLCSTNEIPRNKVIATSINNLIAYYINPGNADFAAADLPYTVDGITNFVGCFTEGDHSKNVSNIYALMGLVLTAEYLNGIAVITIEASGSAASVTATSGAGTTAGTKITVSAPTPAADEHVFIKAGTAAPSVSYLDEVDATWKELVLDENGVADDVEGLTGKATVVITNGVGQIVAASSSVTITNKS